MKFLTKITAFFATIALVFAAGGAANAVPITFSYSGTGTGTVGGVVFTDAAFEILIFGDTDDVLDPSENLDLVDGLTSSISIYGFATGSFDAPLFVFGGAGENYHGFGTDFGSGGSGNLISFFDEPSLTPFDLMSNFGPIFAANENLNQFDGEDSSIGLIAFTQMSEVRFEATVSEVPLPAAAWLFMVGAAGLGAVRKRKA